jgi:lipopolysaccharide export system protein LptA
MRVGTVVFIASAMILPAALAHAQQSATTVTSTVQPAGQPKPAKVPAPSSHGPGLNLGSHDSNAPINVTSDSFVGDLTTKVGTYIGNVIVTQADYKLRSDKLRVDVVDGKPTKFTATGNVVFMSESGGTATGDTGVDDLVPHQITLTGHVVLTKEKDVMRGTMLVVDTVTGAAHLTAQGMAGNRVQGIFTPPPKSNTSDTKKPTVSTTN